MQILEIIRAASKPIHDRLESHGIGEALKKGKIQRKDYSQWMRDTFRINQGLYNHCQKRYAKHYFFQNYLHPHLNHTALKIDLNIMEVDTNDLEPIKFNVADNADFAVIAAYTFTGSQMGIKIIANHIKKHQLNLPMHFIEATLDRFPLWNPFLRDINDYSPISDNDKLFQMTKSTWQTIYDELTHSAH